MRADKDKIENFFAKICSNLLAGADVYFIKWILLLL